MDFDPWEDREATERREMYEDRVREAIDTLRERLDEERAESERLRGLLTIARAGLTLAADLLPAHSPMSQSEIADALRRSDPGATLEPAHVG